MDSLIVPKGKRIIPASKPSSAYNKIMIVGEAAGQQEEASGKPFAGASGHELNSWLSAAGILREDCYVTNVFKFRPTNNDLKTISYATKAEANKAVGGTYPLAPCGSKEYIFLDIALSAIEEIRREIAEYQPNVILALGNVALWALTGSSGISKERGTVQICKLDGRTKVVPTYHPAAVLRQFNLRSIGIADTIKCGLESSSPSIQRKQRLILVDPSLAEIEEFFKTHIYTASRVSVDIETKNGQITCVGVGVSPQLSIVIPFWDKRKNDWNYWPDAASERAAWGFIRDLLANPNIQIVGQNFLYDIQYLYRVMGFKILGEIHDTMLMHHSMYPELEKGLGFLGSIYCNEMSWKHLRTKGQEELKADE